MLKTKDEGVLDFLSVIQNETLQVFSIWGHLKTRQVLQKKPRGAEFEIISKLQVRRSKEDRLLHRAELRGYANAHVFKLTATLASLFIIS